MKNNLQKIRKEKKVSQTEIANLLGVTRQAISLYEQGKRQINEKDLITLSKYFKVSTNYLLGAYSKEEIAKIVQKAYLDHLDVKKGIKFLVFGPLSSFTIDDYSISQGLVPYDIKKEHYLLNENQINNLDFWLELLEPLYETNIGMEWLITKPNLDASEEDVLNAVNSAMNYLINISTNGNYHYDAYNFAHSL